MEKYYLYDIQNDNYLTEIDNEVYSLLKNCIFNIETLDTILNLLAAVCSKDALFIQVVLGLTNTIGFNNPDRIFTVKPRTE